MGPLIERIGPYRCIQISLLTTPAAWAFACLGSYVKQIAIVYVLFGLLLGTGCAFGVVGSVANVQRWFPDYKGLAAGFTVMGFSAGAFMWQLIGNKFMAVGDGWEMAPYQVQGILAIIFVILMTVSLPFIRAPPPGFTAPPAPATSQRSCGMRVLGFLFPTSKPTPPDTEYTFLQAVVQLEFLLICVAMFGAMMPGVVFISSAADMTKYVFGKSASDANTIAAMLNLMNLLGRVVWGVVAERVGRKTFYMWANVAQAVALGLMALWIHLNIYGLWLLSFFVVGSLYGGVHGVLPAFLNQMFGARIAAALHGTLLFVWALADVVGVPIFSEVVAAHATMLNGKRVATPEAYKINAYWLCAMPALSCLVLLFLDTSVRDRTLRKAFKECRVRVCGRVLVIKSLNEAEQEREYTAYKDAMHLHRRIRAGTKSVLDVTPELELQAIPGIVGIFDVHGASTRALTSAGSFSAGGRGRLPSSGFSGARTNSFRATLHPTSAGGSGSAPGSAASAPGTGRRTRGSSAGADDLPGAGVPAAPPSARARAPGLPPLAENSPDGAETGRAVPAVPAAVVPK